MKKLKCYIASLALMLSVAALGLRPAPVYAQFEATKSAACQGIEASGQSCASGDAAMTRVIKAAIDILSIIVGVAAVIMIIISGLRYVTSGGDSSSVSSAKRGLLYAVIGLVITALAQAIVRFVFSRI